MAQLNLDFQFFASKKKKQFKKGKTDCPLFFNYIITFWHANFHFSFSRISCMEEEKFHPLFCRYFRYFTFHFLRITDKRKFWFTYIKSLRDIFSCNQVNARICCRKIWTNSKLLRKVGSNWFAYSNWRVNFRQLSFWRRKNRLKTESSGMAKCLAYAQWTRDIYVCAGRDCEMDIRMLDVNVVVVDHHVAFLWWFTMFTSNHVETSSKFRNFVAVMNANKKKTLSLAHWVGSVFFLFI